MTINYIKICTENQEKLGYVCGFLDQKDLNSVFFERKIHKTLFSIEKFTNFAS